MLPDRLRHLLHYRRSVTPAMRWPRDPTPKEIALRLQYRHHHFVHYTSLTPEGFTKSGIDPGLAVPVWNSFVNYLNTQLPVRDGGANRRRPDGTLAFVLAGNFPLVTKPRYPYGTRLLLSSSGTFYGTSTLFADDRGIGDELRRDHNVDPTGFVCDVRVHHNHRGKRLSSYQMLLLDLMIQFRVNITKVPAEWYLSTKEPKIVHICDWLGWSLFLPDYPVTANDGTRENIYRKLYIPLKNVTV